MRPAGYSSASISAAIRAVWQVPLIFAEMKTPSTSLPRSSARLNAASIDSTEGCDEVGSVRMSSSRR